VRTTLAIDDGVLIAVALLDVNILIALLDSDHVDHRRTHAWMAGEVAAGWASCAITENGFVCDHHPGPLSKPDSACPGDRAAVGRARERTP
jgi:hypothetical protein